MKLLSRYLRIVLILLFLPALSFAAEYYVTKVYDGDTIQVDKMGNKTIIRLVGIDAPETSKRKYVQGQPYSQKAKKHLTSLVYHTTVDIKSYGQGRYGRTLGVVLLYWKTDVNLEMIKAGLAEVYRGKSPKGFDIAPYKKSEAEARQAKRGMWSLEGEYISPRDWRRMNK